MERSNLLTPSERALVDHALSVAGQFKSADGFAAFLRGYRQRTDSEALTNALNDLYLDYKALGQ